MDQQMAFGKDSFLIDGFPRNVNNKQGWEQVRTQPHSAQTVAASHPFCGLP